MESIILRSATIYLFIFIVLRMGGKRALSEMTTFDLVLVLIISEATQQALINDDHSIVGAMLAIVTLVSFDLLMSVITTRSKVTDKILNGVPMFLIEQGKLHEDRLKKANITIDDVLEAGRKLHGLENLNEIKSAVLEKDGKISIIPIFKDKLLQLMKQG
jgi:uncharacterized membrane protein YcaP (DUF421 family)